MKREYNDSMDSPVVVNYRLRDLFKDIDCFDRKISYCQKYETFESEGERAAALGKLMKSRGRLVKQADDLTKTGATCAAKDLPRSFKDEAKNEQALQSTT